LQIIHYLLLYIIMAAVDITIPVDPFIFDEGDDYTIFYRELWENEYYTYVGEIPLRRVNLTLEEGFTAIAEGAFKDVEELQTIKIPASLVTIQKDAFVNATNLHQVYFAQGSLLKTIGRAAFANTTSLKSINIPASVTRIEISAFDVTENLREITFEQNSQIASIGQYAFSRSGLTRVVIGEPALNRLNVERNILNLPPLHFGKNYNFYGRGKVTIVSMAQQIDTLRLSTREVGYKKPPRSGFGYIKEVVGLVRPREKTRPSLPRDVINNIGEMLTGIKAKSPAALAAAAEATEGGARKSRRRKQGIRRSVRRTQKRRRTMKRK
jgi:hypothetical protein